MAAVKIIDDTTKAHVATHEIERISFVVIDPRDNRAFGYIYNTSDDRHQFWAIKTERPAAATVLALKELFELAFQVYSDAEKAKDDANKQLTTPPASSPTGSSEQTVQTQEAPTVVPDTLPTSETSQPAPVISPPPSAALVKAPSLLDDDDWGPPPPVVTKTTSSPPLNILNFDEPFTAVVPPKPSTVDPLDEFFSSNISTTTQSAPSVTVGNSLFDVFSNVAATPAPPPANQYSGFYNQPPQPNLLNTTSSLPQQQQRPVTPTNISFLQQQEFARPSSPVAPPTVTSPFAGLDAFGGLSLAPTGRTTKDAFFPAAPAAKTMQQLLMEKQP